MPIRRRVSDQRISDCISPCDETRNKEKRKKKKEKEKGLDLALAFLASFAISIQAFKVTALETAESLACR